MHPCRVFTSRWCICHRVTHHSRRLTAYRGLWGIHPGCRSSCAASPFQAESGKHWNSSQSSYSPGKLWHVSIAFTQPSGICRNRLAEGSRQKPGNFKHNRQSVTENVLFLQIEKVNTSCPLSYQSCAIVLFWVLPTNKEALDSIALS